MSKNIEYGNVDEHYLEKRQLKKGAAGWILLAGLGVAYVISGDFSGWNLGLAEGGWGGLLIAFLLMGLMYVCMVFGLAELSSTLPTAGAGYGFARRALGPLGGFATGMAILIEYTMLRRRSRHSSPATSKRSASSPNRCRRGRSTSPRMRSSSASTCGASARRCA